tara:strand:- start:96 stop:1334 length:1239 start_codon:yes stop_codon:yes gene_type:complete
MGFKMKGFNPGKGTGMGSSFKKNEIVFSRPKPRRNTQIIDGQMYYDAVTDRRDPGDFSNTTSMDIDPRFIEDDYRLPGQDVDLNVKADESGRVNVNYSDEHERYMGVKDAGAGYGPEEIGLKNKQERLDYERAKQAKKLIRQYDGVLPITPASTEYNKENFDRWRSDPKNKKQAGETQSQYQRRFRNDLADLANIVNEVTMSSEAGYDFKHPALLNEYEAGQFNVNRTKEDIRKKNQELSRDRSRNIQAQRYKDKINRIVDSSGYVPSYEARKLTEMGYGDFVEAVEKSLMTPKEIRKQDRKIAKEQRKSERQERRQARRDKRKNTSEDYVPQSSEEYADQYTKDMDRMIKEDESEKKLVEDANMMLRNRNRNRNYLANVDDDNEEYVPQSRSGFTKVNDGNPFKRNQMRTK